MKRTRTIVAAALASTALAGAGASAANAATVPIPSSGMDTNTSGAGPVRSGDCGSSSGAEDQGGTGGTNTYMCLGAGLTFVGPQIGQIASVIGPTIISPGFTGNVVVSAGNGAIGSNG